MGSEQSKKAKEAGLTLKAGQAAQQSPTGSASPKSSPPAQEGKEPGSSSAGPSPDIQPKQLPKPKLEDFELVAVIGRGQWGKVRFVRIICAWPVFLTHCQVMMVRKRDTGGVFAMKVIRKEYMLGTMCDWFVLFIGSGLMFCGFFSEKPSFQYPK
jgi:hypothetical protein